MARYFGLRSELPEEDSERLTAKALQKLGPEWVILHHVAWQSKRNGRQGDGEADFLVLHPKLGLLILEVKGGGVELVNGRWTSTDRNGRSNRIKNPYEQAAASKHALIAWLQEFGLASRIRLGHAVVFPHLRALPNLGPAATPAITMTRDSLANAESAIITCMKYWELSGNLSNTDVQKLLDLLAPTLVVKRTLAEESATAERALIELTAAQVAAFAGLRSSRGGLVIGGAGTGKTVLAIARAQQLAAEKFKTLLVCYNEILGHELGLRFAATKDLAAGTFHALCFREAQRAQLPIPSHPTREWWEVGAAELLVEACAKTGSNYDAIVVDEAQDFSPDWLASLRCLTPTASDAPFFAFADPKQDLWKRQWHEHADFQFTYELQQNLRNTHPIAEKVAAVLGEKVRGPRGANGPKPMWRNVRDPKRVEGDVISAVEQLIEEGFGPGSVAVLCSSPTLVSSLREHAVGPYSFGRWGGRGIPVETISRFKGMEAEAVVLVLEDGDAEIHRTTAYVGFSRPRSVLVTIGTQKKRVSLAWLNQAD